MVSHRWIWGRDAEQYYAITVAGKDAEEDYTDLTNSQTKPALVLLQLQRKPHRPYQFLATTSISQSASLRADHKSLFSIHL